MVSFELSNLGNMATLRGDLDKASRLYTEALALMRERNDRFAIRNSLVGLMRIAYRLGDVERVRDHGREVVTLGVEQGSPVTAAHALDGLAWVASRRGAAQQAARILGAALARRRAVGLIDGRASRNLESPVQRSLRQEAEAAARAALGEDTFATAFADGEAMSLEQAAAYALDDAGPV
jgi:hypothetical protein